MSYLGQISTKEHHGLQLILRLAPSYYRKGPIPLQKVSQAERISVKYLEQIVVPFRKAGWLKSQRGRVGGYQLIKDPQKISLKDIIDLMEEKPGIVPCLHENKKHSCVFENTCSAKKAWSAVQNAIEQTMANIKIAELMQPLTQ